MQSVHEIADRVRSASPEEWGGIWADALGWSNPGGQTDSVEHQLGSIRGTRALFRDEPALLFIAPENAPSFRGDEELLHSGAIAAYHASIDWGVITDASGVTVFNSRWIRNRDWYRLPHLSWDRLGESETLVHALSPEGITSGALPRIATSQFYTADDYLRPVDEELVRRLDAWRRRALSIAPNFEGVDAALQVLFAQLFVLRAVEDRVLAPGLMSLEHVVSGLTVDRNALDQLFEEAKARVQSELFSAPPADLIAEEVIAGVITDLYVPRHLPRAARYNFAWLDADVLGRAYEKYLSRVLEALPPPDQQDLFGTARAVGERDVRRQEGVYYTPSYLVRSLVAQALDPVLEPLLSSKLSGPITPTSIVAPLTQAALHYEGPSPATEHTPLPFIGDFACGSGGFLVAAADYLLRRLRERNPERPWAHDLIQNQHLVGIDKDPRAVTLTRLNLYIRLTSEPESLPLPSLERCIVAGDSLTDEPWTNLPPAYDAVLGNPPFIATGQQLSREDLTKRFETAQGRFDFAYLFVELAVRKLKPHGTLSLVVPNRLFRNRDAGPIRGLLTCETDLLCIVDFGSLEVFQGVGAYIGAITARRRADIDPEATAVRVIHVRTVEDVSFLGALITRAAEEADPIRNDTLEAFSIAHPRLSGPWLLLPPKARARRMALSSAAIPLAELAPSRQGIRTGANDIFIVTIESSANGYARVMNAAGETATMETGLLRPVVFGTEIQRYDITAPTKYLLYPYRRGVAVEEQELREKFPKTWEYLSRYRTDLAERGSLVKTGGRWYELIWKRDEAWLDQPKLLIRDLVLEMAFAADPGGETYLVGGTAVIPADPAHLWPLLGYLNSNAVGDYLRQSTPAFRGGFQKIEPRHLDTVPVPSVLIEDSGEARQIGEAAQIAAQAKVGERFSELRKAEEHIERIVEEMIERLITAERGPSHEGAPREESVGLELHHDEDRKSKDHGNLIL